MALIKKSGLNNPENQKIINLFLVLVMVAGFFAVSCKSPPPIRPALSQTVVNVQRSATRQDKGKVIIYVNDIAINPKAQMNPGQFYTFAVNNGVHYIHASVKGGGLNLVSEAINFSASNKTVSFIVTVENVPGSLTRKKLVITRSDVIDDTGRQTNLEMQEAYTTQ